MEKKDWILAFLYSKGATNEYGEPIKGSLRIMKNLFLFWKEGTSLNLQNIYNEFKKYNYGPCDFNVYTDLNNLKNQKLIEEIDIGRNYSQFQLTLVGFKKAQSIFEALSLDTQKLISSIKKETNNRENLIALLRFIYGKYPEWAENSLIKI